MELWMVLMIAKKIIDGLCPFTSKFLAMLGIIFLVAEFVFIALCFFFGTEWWFGFIALAIYIIPSMLIPKVDASAFERKPIARLFSTVGSLVSKVLLIGMYLSLFKIV